MSISNPNEADSRDQEAAQSRRVQPVDGPNAPARASPVKLYRGSASIGWRVKRIPIGKLQARVLVISPNAVSGQCPHRRRHVKLNRLVARADSQLPNAPTAYFLRVALPAR